MEKNSKSIIEKDTNRISIKNKNGVPFQDFINVINEVAMFIPKDVRLIIDTLDQADEAPIIEIVYERLSPKQASITFYNY